MEFQWFTVLALFAEGLLSFLSPCVLPILPIYIGLLAGGAEGKEG
ncbi:TPA: cytochrome c biogenesis protein CcdA, partial [Streptococcus suis]|nr:cytochrome c biogenesis protein CcdA [Streptococcus suis]HEM5248539.1 cytochrome c biogenesis protein CcdA [Streptococcus suis]HEO8633514.1 cytochrome c biogenesis protein CcdA [Streptococcus suis]